MSTSPFDSLCTGGDSITNGDDIISVSHQDDSRKRVGGHIVYHINIICKSIDINIHLFENTCAQYK